MSTSQGTGETPVGSPLSLVLGRQEKLGNLGTGEEGKTGKWEDGNSGTRELANWETRSLKV